MAEMVYMCYPCWICVWNLAVKVTAVMDILAKQHKGSFLIGHPVQLSISVLPDSLRDSDSCQNSPIFLGFSRQLDRWGQLELRQIWIGMDFTVAAMVENICNCQGCSLGLDVSVSRRPRDALLQRLGLVSRPVSHFSSYENLVAASLETRFLS